MYDNLKLKLIECAIEKHGVIKPCDNKTIEQCFTEERGRLYFWYNDPIGSSHIEFESIPIQYVSRGRIVTHPVVQIFSN